MHYPDYHPINTDTTMSKFFEEWINAAENAPFIKNAANDIIKFALKSTARVAKLHIDEAVMLRASSLNDLKDIVHRYLGTVLMPKINSPLATTGNTNKNVTFNAIVNKFPLKYSKNKNYNNKDYNNKNDYNKNNSNRRIHYWFKHAVVLIVNMLLQNTKISRTVSLGLTTIKKLTINRSMSLPKHSMMMNLEKKLLVLVQLQTKIIWFQKLKKKKNIPKKSQKFSISNSY